MNRLLDRKIEDEANIISFKVHEERSMLLGISSELATGKRQVELGQFELAACQLRKHIAAYNALVALRVELGE